MRAIGYVRVSTTGQADGGLSLEAQRTRIQAWCDANGYTLEAIRVDAGLSGKRADNRPGLQQALDLACRFRGTAVVVYSLSRLARSTKDAIGIAERLDKAGADLVSLSERIDTTSAAGKMVFRMLAVLAEFERDLVAERTTAALAVKRANGQRIGAVPYGFDLADDGTTLAPNADEQRIIHEIQAMKSTGATLREIAIDLTDRGVPTKTASRTLGRIRQSLGFSSVKKV
jgi:site-specific DNA recombinase